MNKSAIILLLFFVLSAMSILNAQEKVKIDKSNFKLEKDGFDEAWFNIREGDKCYLRGGGLYADATKYYREAYKFNSENAALNYKLGVSSLLGNDKQAALSYFLKARILNTEVADDIVLLTGRAYQYRGDFSKAIDCYNMYSDHGMEKGKIDPVVTRYIKECNLAIESGLKDGNIKLINLGAELNSPSDDYSPVPVKEDNLLYFTTRRQTDKKEDLLRTDNKWNENVFIATSLGETWSDTGPAGKEIATPLNEGVLYVDKENTFMLIYAGWVGNGDILISEFDRGEWTEPEVFNDEMSTPFRETSVSLTSDGSEIFFTSDRNKSNLGGRDIYQMKRIKKNKWTKPMNLGPLVNSPGNEESVCTSVTGDTIWFSSNGRPGFGAYDVFMALRQDDGTFREAVNLGMPLNSQWNDISFKPSTINRNISFFSSDRPGGAGGLDIYKLVRLTAFDLKADTIKQQY